MRLDASLARSLPPAQLQKWIDGLSEDELAALNHEWKFWGRVEQQEPEGSWLTWLVLAGRGWGKTKTGSEIIRGWVESGRYGRLALVAETAADARDVIVEGDSGILRCAPGWFRPQYEPSKRRLTWPNGAVATLYNGTEPDQLRGPQHDAAWVDELAKYQSAQETWDQLQFGLRLGNSPRQLVTTTPRPIPLIRSIAAASNTVVTKGRTFDNAANLAPSFIKSIRDRYEGTRLGRQELEAEILDDVPGALWTRAMFDDNRISSAPEMQRIVVAVDPSGTKGESDDGDSIGIVVAGRGVDGRGYVLADRSCKLSPDGWGRRAVAAYHEFSADRVIGEDNFGGAMVEHVIKTADRMVSYKAVKASRGKVVRAEPVAALYEQGKVSHVSALPHLEDQMSAFTPSGYMGEASPDRADALVWALTELMIGSGPSMLDVL
jgi:predicted phage terminase large subunit-like protein